MRWGWRGKLFCVKHVWFSMFFFRLRTEKSYLWIHDIWHLQKLKVQRWRSSLQFTSFVRCICCLPHHNKWSRSFPLLGRSLGSLFGGCSPPLDLVDVGRDFWSSKLEMSFPYGGQSCPPKNCAMLHGSLHKMSKFSLVTSLEMISQVIFGVF